MYSIDNYNFNGKKVLMRVDFNVPLDENQKITDDTRIVTALPSIQKILSENGALILLTHLGRPKGKYDEKLSVKHIVPYLSSVLEREVKYVDECVGDKVKKTVSELKTGEVLILENLRFHPEEKMGDADFARQLADLGDVYINDAFGTAHRAHASTYTIAKYFSKDKMLGYLVESEIKNIDRVLNEPEHPFTAIIGGSKISTKIHIIKALIEKVDNLIIAGGIAYTFSKATGGKIGNSIVEDEYMDVALEIIDKAKKFKVNLYLPTDCIIADKFENDANIKHTEIDKIPDGWMGLDVGIKSANQFANVIENSKKILWNGPIGVFEMSNFSMGTLKIAMAVASATDRGAFSLLGGGDSISAVNKYGLANRISFVSTAGGALLEYLEGKELPSLRAIREQLTIDNYDFNEKRVLMRVDFNVPMDENYNVIDNTRIITALPTVRKILTDGGSIIFLTHLGRPGGEYEESLSLKHIVPYLSRILDKEIKFVDDPIGRRAKLAAENLQPGEILLLENLRFHKEELDGDEEFARQLAELGDVYVNNSFGTAHRAHASTYTIANYFPHNKMLGYLVENEINNINRVIRRPKRPFTAILGGSQVSTKIHIIRSLLQKVDNLIIAGGIAYTFVKAKGGDVGDSLVEDDYLDVAREILNKAEEMDVRLLLPIDCVVADEFSNNSNVKHSDISKIEKGWRGMDIGIKSANKFAEVIESSSSILWNGPIGVFEMSNFSSGTLRIALAVTRATDKGAYSLISGGDSISALNKYNLAHKVSYVSTAGGALLEFIEGKELPSLKAVKENI